MPPAVATALASVGASAVTALAGVIAKKFAGSSGSIPAHYTPPPPPVVAHPVTPTAPITIKSYGGGAARNGNARSKKEMSILALIATVAGLLSPALAANIPYYRDFMIAMCNAIGVGGAP